MQSEIAMINNDDLKNRVQIIMRQTTYTESIALEKLKELNFDHLKVIKEFMGLTEKKIDPIKSVNQEIYKQIRIKMNSTMTEFNKKNPPNLHHLR